MSDLTRRAALKQLAAQLAAAGLSGCMSFTKDPETPAPPRIMDIHVHLFGNGDSGSGCLLSFLHPRSILHTKSALV